MTKKELAMAKAFGDRANEIGLPDDFWRIDPGVIHCFLRQRGWLIVYRHPKETWIKILNKDGQQIFPVPDF